MNARERWSRNLIVAGGTGMLIGAIDPMEGSLLILPGSGLIALGVFLGQKERRLILYRVWAFALVSLGVGALWGLSAMGGFGGSTGRSNWWGVLILPYLVGWSMGIWGPGSPRWMLWLGIGAGLWHLAIAAMILKGLTPREWIGLNPAAIVLAVIGVLTITGCIIRLKNRTSH